MSKKIIPCLVIASALALFSFYALAQEEVTASDLEVSDSGIFSWIQDIVRDIQILITFDPIKKSELQLKKASRQLIRIREIVNADPADPRLQKRVEKFDAKYESLIDKINSRIEEVKSEDADLPELGKFLDKYADHQLKHQEILAKLEEQVPEDVMEKIRANRERHLEKFGEVMNRLQEKENCKDQADCESPTSSEEIGGYPGYIIKGIQAKNALQQTISDWRKNMTDALRSE